MTRRHDRTAFPWPSLPAEIRLLIFDEIASQKHRGWAQCAAVCKEWQAIIEPKNFSRLTVRPSCLNELETLARQRPLVQHICLHIELPRYDCSACDKDDSFSTHRFSVVKEAILRLFSILSTWPPTGRLTLELSASSPSDSQHYFKDYFFGPGHEDTRDWTQEEKAIRWHDPKHGWFNGQQIGTPRVRALVRLFTALCYDVPKCLPAVHAVTHFCIRRQLRHELNHEVLEQLWEKLPRLESISYELWRVQVPSRYPVHNACGNELASLVQASIPKHVKRISIFNNVNNQLTSALAPAWPYFIPPYMSHIPPAELALSTAFAAKSPHLEHLSISYMIDAQQFFTSCQRLLPDTLLPMTWPLLQTLTLTSSTLARTSPHHDICTLLRQASSVALRMPQLRTMVLWNSEPGHACAVIYQRRAGIEAALTWRSTWDLELRHDVVESWEKVDPGACYLRLEKEVLRDVDIRSHGDAIHYLRLPEGVVDSESLSQIRHEGRMQRTV